MAAEEKTKKLISDYRNQAWKYFVGVFAPNTSHSAELGLQNRYSRVTELNLELALDHHFFAVNRPGYHLVKVFEVPSPESTIAEGVEVWSES